MDFAQFALFRSLFNHSMLEKSPTFIKAKVNEISSFRSLTEFQLQIVLKDLVSIIEGKEKLCESPVKKEFDRIIEKGF